MKLGFYVARPPAPGSRAAGVTFVTFALTRIVPGDPIALIAGPYVSPDRKAEIRCDRSRPGGRSPPGASRRRTSPWRRWRSV